MEQVLAYLCSIIKINFLLQEVVTDISRITHTHVEAIHGAILQCSAVTRALKETDTELDRGLFLDRLSRKMLLVEQTSKKAKYVLYLQISAHYRTHKHAHRHTKIHTHTDTHTCTNI